MPDTHENGAEAPTNQPSTTGDNARSTAIPEDPRTQTNLPGGTFFGLNRNQMHSWGIGTAPRDYKARYPLDPYGQEMSDKARIWSIYLDEAADFDANMLAAWRDTIDVLLVFAALFSAILTTFVVQTSQSMQPDYNQASAFLFFQILNATMSNGSQFSLPSSPTAFNFSPSRSSEWLNSLWFVSLTLSLITALVAVLVKQWLHQYVAIVSDSSARDRARIRHLRYAGLQAWQVPMIIGMLPVLLHVSLALFFAGLAIFLFTLGMKVAWLVSIIGAATYIAYIIALILPVIYPYCPFKAPLTFYVHPLYQFVIDSLIPRIALVRHYPYSHVFGRDRDNFRLVMYRQRRDSIFRRRKRPLKEIEYDQVQKWGAKVDAQSLQWLYSSTSNASVHQSVLQACSGMTSATLKCLPDECLSTFVVSLRQQIEQIDPLVPRPGTEREFELWYRAYILLRPEYDYSRLSSNCDRMADQCSNEQLKMVLYSMTNTAKALTVLLGILESPQRFSLTLHSTVWNALVDTAMSLRPSSGSAVFELELELMKIIASPLSTSAGRDVTTIDNPTDEMRKHTCHRLLTFWEYDRTEILVPLDSDQLLSIMLCFIPRIQHRLSSSVYASDREDVIQTSLAIIDRIDFLIRPFASEQVINALCSLLSSEAFATVGDLETLARRIFMILDRHRKISPNTQMYSVAYQCYLRSPADWLLSSENDAMLPILERLQSSSENISPNLSTSYADSHMVHSRRAALFSIDAFFSVVLLLISRRNESILYEWARHPLAHEVWPACLPRLVRWAYIQSSEGSCQLAFLERFLAISTIRKLRDMLGYPGDEYMPQYTCVAHRDVIRFPWLLDVASPGLDPGREPYIVKYSHVENHPDFQEYLQFYLESAENIDPVTGWTELDYSE